MKKTVLNIFLISLIGLIVFHLPSCEGDKVIEPCGDNVIININARYDYDCDGQCDRAAANGQLIIMKNNVATDSITLDEEGHAQYIIPESGCGIPEGFSFAVAYRDYYNLYSIPYECDTAHFNICLTCDSLQEIDCDSLDGLVMVDTVRMLDEFGDTCITINSPMSEIIKNSTGLTYDGEYTLRVHVDPLLNYSDEKFSFASMSRVQTNGYVDLIFREELKLFFNVKTNETGEYSDQIDLVVDCIDANGNVYSSGIWRIILIARICDVDCDCPFGDQGDVQEAYDFGTIKIGETASKNDIEIFTLEEGMIADGCTLELIDIVRLSGDREEVRTRSDSAGTYDISPNTILSRFDNDYDFNITDITAPISTPRKLSVNSTMAIDANFIPQFQRETVDTFRLVFRVMSGGAIKVDSCFYDFSLMGNGCSDACPDLEMAYRTPNDKVIIRNTQNNDVIDDNFEVGETTTLAANSNPEVVEITYDLYYKWPCTEDSVAEHSFDLNYPAGIVFCDEDNKEFEIRERFSGNYKSGEYEMFDYDMVGSIESGYSIDFEYTPPTKLRYQELAAQGLVSNDNIINASFEVISNDGQCHQIFNFEVTLVDIYYKLSPVWHLESFSQITTKKSTPDYMTCDITDERGGYFGADKNNPASIADGNVVSGDNGDSFFFNVDQPTNTGIVGQWPRLYLVSGTGNPFDKILATPVAKFATEDEFQNGLDAIVTTHLRDVSFVQQGSNTNSVTITRNGLNGWDTSPSTVRDKDEFTNANFPNGVIIEPGDVFLIWDSNGISTENNETYYCTVALIFIKSVDDGSGNGDTNDVAVIGYRVVYPIVINVSN